MSMQTEPVDDIDPDDFEGADELRRAAYLEDHADIEIDSADIDPADWEEGDD